MIRSRIGWTGTCDNHMAAAVEAGGLAAYCNLPNWQLNFPGAVPLPPTSTTIPAPSLVAAISQGNATPPGLPDGMAATCIDGRVCYSNNGRWTSSPPAPAITTPASQPAKPAAAPAAASVAQIVASNAVTAAAVPASNWTATTAPSASIPAWAWVALSAGALLVLSKSRS